MFAKTSYFYRNRQHICSWLHNIPSRTTKQQQSSISGSQITSDTVSEHIYMCFSSMQSINKFSTTQAKQISKKQQNVQSTLQQQGLAEFQIEQLWNKNQQFMQCLRDLSEDIIYYAYAEGNAERQTLPKCLIGYYQIVKNIAHCQHHNEKNVKIQPKIQEEENKIKQSKTKQKTKAIQKEKKKLQREQQQIERESETKFPKQLKLFAQQKMIQILLSQAPFSYIRQSLIKLQDSAIPQIFKKQLSHFIIIRFQYFCKLFSISMDNKYKDSLSSYFVKDLLQSANQDSDLCMPIDLMLLSLIYASYKKSGYKILFASLVQTYDKSCGYAIDRQKLLDFYNEIFIMRLLPTDLLQKIKILQIWNQNQNQNQEQQHKNKDSQMKDSGVPDSKTKGNRMLGSGFQYQKIKQQKQSIYGLFQ